MRTKGRLSLGKKCERRSHFMLRRSVSNGGGFTPSDMLGLTSRATPIRRIRIQRGPGSLFTHTSNNAVSMAGFQKNSTNLSQGQGSSGRRQRRGPGGKNRGSGVRSTMTEIGKLRMRFLPKKLTFGASPGNEWRREGATHGRNQWLGTTFFAQKIHRGASAAPR